MKKLYHFEKRTNEKLRRITFAVLGFLCLLALTPSAAFAFNAELAPSYTAPHFDEDGMTAGDLMLFSDPTQTGFSLTGSYAAGLDVDSDLRLSRPSLLSEERAYALLLNGKYDFNAGSTSPWRPYVSGSFGVALVGFDTNGFRGSAMNSSALPLFRLGGGISYQLDQKWDLALDFKTGLFGRSSSETLFTGRSQEPVDLQTLNMGVKYKF